MLDRPIPVEKRVQSLSTISRNLPDLFLKRAAHSPDAPAWKRKLEGEWVTTTWHDFHRAAAAVATFLLERGLRVGEKITICGGTRPEWGICDIGGLLAGAVNMRTTRLNLLEKKRPGTKMRSVIV